MSGSFYRELPGAAEPRPMPLPPSVLCVQMHAQNQAFVRAALPACRVSIIENASGALRSINKSSYDAYVLDYWMPDWTGVGLCREIRKSDPYVPIVFYSSAANHHKARALRAGAHAYIAAPAPPEAVTGSLGQLLARAEVQNVRARFAAEKVVADEIERHVTAFSSSGRSPQEAAGTIHRATKPKAAQVFLEAGGTRAAFERFWEDEFALACSRQGIAAPSTATHVYPASARTEQPETAR